MIKRYSLKLLAVGSLKFIWVLLLIGVIVSCCRYSSTVEKGREPRPASVLNCIAESLPLGEPFRQQAVDSVLDTLWGQTSSASIDTIFVVMCCGARVEVAVVGAPAWVVDNLCLRDTSVISAEGIRIGSSMLDVAKVAQSDRLYNEWGFAHYIRLKSGWDAASYPVEMDSALIQYLKVDFFLRRKE